MNERLKPRSNLYLLLSLSIFIIACDQISKNFASNYFKVLCNASGVFGFGVGNYSNLLLSLASFVILAYFTYLVFRQKEFEKGIAIALITSGGISNFMDRILLGCVRDFIVIYKYFPAFNLSDFFISVGVLLFVFPLFNNFKKL